MVILELLANIGHKLNNPGVQLVKVGAKTMREKSFFLKNTKNLSFLDFCAYLCDPKKEEMANHAATKKDVRQSAKRNERNRYYGKTTRNAIRDLRATTEHKAATDQLPEVSSMIDKLARRGTIHKNKAANLKRKMALKVNALKK